MKVTYLERIEHHNAWSRKMYCPFCGGHEYEVIEQLEPYTTLPWKIRCPQCENESKAASTRTLAIEGWKAI